MKQQKPDPRYPWRASKLDFAKHEFHGWEFPGIEAKLSGIQSVLFEAAFNGAKQMLHNLFCYDKKCCGSIIKFFSVPFLDKSRSELIDPLTVRLYTEWEMDESQNDCLFTVDIPFREILKEDFAEAAPNKRRAFVTALRKFADELEQT